MPHEGLTPLERAADAVLSDIRRQVGNYSLRSTIGPAIATDAAINLGDLTRAVLQAIREPSEAMIEKGLVAITGCYEQGVGEVAADAAWQVMIDAALEEGP